jgi:hypothetical protein
MSDNLIIRCLAHTEIALKNTVARAIRSKTIKRKEINKENLRIKLIHLNRIHKLLFQISSI